MIRKHTHTANEQANQIALIAGILPLSVLSFGQHGVLASSISSLFCSKSNRVPIQYSGFPKRSASFFFGKNDD